jgi:hypothetical protein
MALPGSLEAGLVPDQDLESLTRTGEPATGFLDALLGSPRPRRRRVDHGPLRGDQALERPEVAGGRGVLRPAAAGAHPELTLERDSRSPLRLAASELADLPPQHLLLAPESHARFPEGELGTLASTLPQLAQSS